MVATSSRRAWVLILDIVPPPLAVTSLVRQRSPPGSRSGEAMRPARIVGVDQLARMLPGLGISALNIWAPTVDLPALRECLRGASLTELDVSHATDASEMQITYAVGDSTLKVRGMRQLEAALGAADVASI